MPNFLMEKMGPLPVWAWGGMIGVGGFLVLKRLQGQAQSSPVQIPVLDGGSLYGGGGGSGPVESAPTMVTGGPEPFVATPPQVPSPMVPTGGNGAFSNLPACRDAPAGAYCMEHYTDAGGVYFADSRPDIGQVPAGSEFWRNMSSVFSYEIEQIPGFQFQPGGIKYFGTPPPGVPTYGYPLLGAGSPNQQSK